MFEDIDFNKEQALIFLFETMRGMIEQKLPGIKTFKFNSQNKITISDSYK